VCDECVSVYVGLYVRKRVCAYNRVIMYNIKSNLPWTAKSLTPKVGRYIRLIPNEHLDSSVGADFAADQDKTRHRSTSHPDLICSNYSFQNTYQAIKYTWLVTASIIDK
jgi:hypothetical protein